MTTKNLRREIGVVVVMTIMIATAVFMTGNSSTKPTGMAVGHEVGMVLGG